MTFEHAVESAAVLLIVLGAAAVVLWALFRSRLRLLGALLLVLGLATLAGGAILGAWTWHESRPRDVRGSRTIEFSRELHRQGAESRDEPWPTYGRDLERTHLAPFGHRPPYRQVWRLNTSGAIEYPPSVAYGRLYFNSYRGHFYALDAASGQILWQKRLGHCSPASPMASSDAAKSVSSAALESPPPEIT